MQGTHADAQGQGALAVGAIEGPFGDVAPGSGEVLQHVQTESFGYQQARLAGVVRWQQQVFLDRIDQWMGVDAQCAVQPLALKQ
ncbi:hypothetical protein FQZ97_1074020 [compost metagenome]